MQFVASKLGVLLLLVLSATVLGDSSCPASNSGPIDTKRGDITAGSGYKNTDKCSWQLRRHGRHHAVLSVNIMEINCTKNLYINGVEYCGEESPVSLVFMEKCKETCDAQNNCTRISSYPVNVTYGEEATDNGFSLNYEFTSCDNNTEDDHHNVTDGSFQDYTEVLEIEENDVTSTMEAVSLTSEENEINSPVPEPFTAAATTSLPKPENEENSITSAMETVSLRGKENEINSLFPEPFTAVATITLPKPGSNAVSTGSSSDYPMLTDLYDGFDFDTDLENVTFTTPESEPPYLLALLVPLGIILFVFFVVMAIVFHRRKKKRDYDLPRLQKEEPTTSKLVTREVSV